MIPSVQEILSSLYGAWRLVLRDAEGMRWLTLTVPGFWNSFFGIVLVLPIVLVVATLPGAGKEVLEISYGMLAFETVVAWTIRPFILLGLCYLLNRTQRFVALMIAWNWVSVMQTVIFTIAAMLIAVIPGISGLLFLVVLAVMLLIDNGAADDLKQRLAPLLADGSPWRYSALEMQAILIHREGDTAGARAAFKALSDDAAAPAGMRNRAAQMLAALGS